jgi:hypothetical protein
MGGRAARRHPHDLRQFATPKDAGELLAITMESIIELRDDRLDPKTAAALSALVNAAMALIRTHTLENRLATIEQRDRERELCKL